MKVTSSEHTHWNITAVACKIALVTATHMTHRPALRRGIETSYGEPCNVMGQGGPHVLSALMSESFVSIDSAIADHRTRALEAYILIKKLHGGPPNPVCSSTSVTRCGCIGDIIIII